MHKATVQLILTSGVRKENIEGVIVGNDRSYLLSAHTLASEHRISATLATSYSKTDVFMGSQEDGEVGARMEVQEGASDGGEGRGYGGGRGRGGREGYDRNFSVKL